jgi:hypothetical protein
MRRVAQFESFEERTQNQPNYEYRDVSNATLKEVRIFEVGETLPQLYVGPPNFVC